MIVQMVSLLDVAFAIVCTDRPNILHREIIAVCIFRELEKIIIVRNLPFNFYRLII